MKRAVILLVAIISCCYMRAQETKHLTGISIYPVVEDNNIPREASKLLESKLQQAISINGPADGFIQRFVFAAIVNVTKKDIVPSTPSRISQTIDISFVVGDIFENKTMDNLTITLTGIGTTETKAFISAFNRINPNDEKIQTLLNNSRLRIVDYYTKNCAAFMTKAQTLATMGNDDDAITILMSYPNVNQDCFEACQKLAVQIYEKKIRQETTSYLEKAKTIWATNHNTESASQIAEILSKINPLASNYSEVEAFRNVVAEQLDASAKKEWDFMMKQYEDKQVFKNSIVEACRAIGVAFGNGQPKEVTKTIIRGWF